MRFLVIELQGQSCLLPATVNRPRRLDLHSRPCLTRPKSGHARPILKHPIRSDSAVLRFQGQRRQLRELSSDQSISSEARFYRPPRNLGRHRISRTIMLKKSLASQAPRKPAGRRASRLVLAESHSVGLPRRLNDKQKPLSRRSFSQSSVETGLGTWDPSLGSRLTANGVRVGSMTRMIKWVLAPTGLSGFSVLQPSQG